MTMTQEAGQSLASAQALDTYFEAGQRVSDARLEVMRIQRQLREARKTLKAAESAEKVAEAAYIATPYAEGA